MFEIILSNNSIWENKKKVGRIQNTYQFSDEDFEEIYKKHKGLFNLYRKGDFNKEGKMIYNNKGELINEVIE